MMQTYADANTINTGDNLTSTNSQTNGGWDMEIPVNKLQMPNNNNIVI